MRIQIYVYRFKDSYVVASNICRMKGETEKPDYPALTRENYIRGLGAKK